MRERLKKATGILMTLVLILSTVLTPAGVLSVFAAGENAVEPDREIVAGVTYYVDAQNGDDGNSGRSKAEAWKSFSNVNATRFWPGDRILLKAGCVWNEQLFPKGSGSPGSNIVIDRYGEGARPVINGMGTTPVSTWGESYATIPDVGTEIYGGAEAPGTTNYTITGAVMLYNQEYWEIRNLEVTNSVNPADHEAYKKDTANDAERAGILVYSDIQASLCEGITIKNCYVHDVQTRLQSVRPALKATGGIIILGHYLQPDGTYPIGLAFDTKSRAGFKNVLIEGNYVQRVGLEGIRTKCNSNTSKSGNTFKKRFENIVIRNNYIEDVAGDAIVLSEVKSGGVVENNVIKQACNADFGVKNFAGVWSMSSNDALFQYNDTYGITYGYNDGEAYDIDLDSPNNTYQYNYSHNNRGGFLLFMNGKSDNATVCYNISANDGAGNQGTGYHYERQGIFHTATKGQLQASIYNNTFYVGDGISTSMYSEGGGNNNTSKMTTGSTFWNNIVLKEGAGDFYWVYTHNQNKGGVVGSLPNDPGTYMTNNILYSTKTGDATPFFNCGFDAEELAQGNNIGEDPRLVLEETGVAFLEEQQESLESTAAEDIYERCSVETLRKNLEGFKLQEDSPALGTGKKTSGAVKKDIFGNKVEGNPDIGAHQFSIPRLGFTGIESVTVEAEAGIYPALPKTVMVNYKDSVTGAVYSEEQAVVWDELTYDQYTTEGIYTVEGSVEDLEEKAVAVIKVVGMVSEETGTKKFAASEDAYIEYGSGVNAEGTITTGTSDTRGKYPYGSNASTYYSFNNNYTLKVKNACGNDGKPTSKYNRRSLIRFDLAEFDGDKASVKNAKIQLHVSRYDLAGQKGGLEGTARKLWIYNIGDKEWTEDTVTWAQASEWWTDSEIVMDGVEFVNKDIMNNNHTIELDVTEAIKNAKGDSISFLIAITDSTGYDDDNSGFDFISKEGATAYAKDILGDESKHVDYAPSLIISNTYEEGVEVAPITTKRAIAPVLPETVSLKYSDGTSREIPVDWENVPEELYSKRGTFTVKGTSAYTNLPIKIQVTVTAKIYVAMQDLPGIVIPFGKPVSELGLRDKLNIILDDGTLIEVPIIRWDGEPPYNMDNGPTRYVFRGQLEVPAGYDNPYGYSPSIVVKTVAEIASVIIPKEEIPEGGFVIGAAESIQLPLIIDANHEINGGVTWSVVPADSQDTTTSIPGLLIDENGLLTTTVQTPAGKYLVTATSNVDSTKSDSVVVTIMTEGIGELTDLAVLIEYAKEAKEESSYKYVVARVREMFEKALSDAIIVNNKPTATQAEIDKAYGDLLKTVHLLEFKGNMERLESLVVTAREESEAKYTPGSWTSFAEALQEAETILAEGNTLQAEIDAARTKLLNAIFGLREVPNKDKLEQLLGKVKAMDLSACSAETAKAVRAAYAQAAEVFEDENADQKAVDAAAAALEEAVKAANAEAEDKVVSDNVKDKMAAVGKTTSTEKTKNKTASNTAAKTGDSTNAAIPVAAGLAAVLAVLVAWKKKVN